VNRTHPAASRHLRLGVIVGSTREQRFGETVARWLLDHASGFDWLELDLIDLRDLELPSVHQSHPVASGEYLSPAVRAFAARVEAADAFVVVTPEYNHGYPAALKLAIDSVHAEWKAKPVGFVSYGGKAGGLRAVEQLRLVFAELHATTIRDCVSFHMARRQFDEHGRPRDSNGVTAAADTLLCELAWWADALREARARQPYAW
jgi:NAD(P)H-dependent FMN reductase